MPRALVMNRDPRHWSARRSSSRALLELERRGWHSCFIAGDSWGNATAVRAANRWEGEILGMALGHARLSDRTDGERPPVNSVVWDAMGQLLQNDYSAFVRYGLTQLTQGSIGDELAKRMLERIPMDIANAAFETIVREPEPIEHSLGFRFGFTLDRLDPARSPGANPAPVENRGDERGAAERKQRIPALEVDD
jgi:hypothetical protein